MRVLIAPDKFKGTLTAREAARAIARGWCRMRPDDLVTLLPLCDGGDGFGAALVDLLNAKVHHIKTVDAAHRPITAPWWWQARTRSAIIESAKTIGLALLQPRKFHPFHLDTRGLGEMLLAARRHKARKIILGIGGSATNDGGFGLARALGWTFWDRAGKEIKQWTQLDRLARVVPGCTFLKDQLLVAVDVQNPLLGPQGASRIYGPQKGLRPRDIARAEKCLRTLAAKMRDLTASDFSQVPGAGAAGGLGFGLQAFAGAKLESGFGMFANHAGLDSWLGKVDLVLTGEGAIDATTMQGKGVGELARRCRDRRVPCVGFAGAVTLTVKTKKVFTQTCALTDFTTAAQALRRPGFWLAHVAEKTAENLVCNRSPRR